LRHITKPDEESEDIIDMIHQTTVENINLMPNIVVGDGEMPYSKYYKDIIFDKNPSKEISILTNGTLFNEQNWQKIRSKYDKIKRVSVSIDAASKETYKYVRGGDFDALMKNLRMLSELRKKEEIEKFVINFTIASFNFREMKDFVKLARELLCDICEFHKIRTFAVFKPNELYTVDVYDEKNQFHNEFLDIISDPIFRSPDVSVSDRRGIEHLFKDIEVRR
jgi:MoaA/NifB/PqqE/SkfB family radical SAM enzyme